MRRQCQPSPVQQRRGGGQRSVRGRLSAWPLLVRRPDQEHNVRGLAGTNTPRRSTGVCVPAAGDEGTGAGLWGTGLSQEGLRAALSPVSPEGPLYVDRAKVSKTDIGCLWQYQTPRRWLGERWENSSQTDFGAKWKKKRKWSRSVVSTP